MARHHAVRADELGRATLKASMNGAEQGSTGVEAEPTVGVDGVMICLNRLR